MAKKKKKIIIIIYFPRLVCKINFQDQFARSNLKTSLKDICKTINEKESFLERTTRGTFRAMCKIIFTKCMEDQKAACSRKHPFIFQWHNKTINLVPFPLQHS
jgi:hypothetical protein